MVKVIENGDLFQSKAQTLVNTVNTVGVMGKGVALEFKKRFPEMYEDYLKRCARREVRLGRPYLYRRPERPWILNFPTKEHWRSVSRLADIVEGLEYLEHHYYEWGITSLAIPPLGCGQGGLDWQVVGPTLVKHLERLDIPVELYAPHGTTKQLQMTFEEPVGAAANNGAAAGTAGLNPAWVALARVLAEIEHEPYHWPIGRISFQKIAYFATESGLPTGLDYQRGSYGPFAPDLKHFITRLVNNGLIEERQLGNMLAVRPGPTYQDAARRYAADLQRWQPLIDRIVDLFLRMRTQQAEVAATVHFAANELASEIGTEPSEAQVLEAVMRWKQRRRPPLDEHEVAQTIRHLNLLGWLNLQPSTELPLPEEALLEA